MAVLTQCSGEVEARILAARLGAEGIVWQVRGGVGAPYSIGAVELLVPVEDLAVARAAIGEDDPGVDPEVFEQRETTGRDVLWAALVLVGVVLFAIARMAAG